MRKDMGSWTGMQVGTHRWNNIYMASGCQENTTPIDRLFSDTGGGQRKPHQIWPRPIICLLVTAASGNARAAKASPALILYVPLILIRS